METYDIAEAAARTGISVEELRRLCELGMLAPEADERFTPGHLRRAGLILSLVGSGIPLEGLSEAIRGGQVSLDFLDAAAAHLAEQLGRVVQRASIRHGGRASSGSATG